MSTQEDTTTTTTSTTQNNDSNSSTKRQRNDNDTNLNKQKEESNNKKAKIVTNTDSLSSSSSKQNKEAVETLDICEKLNIPHGTRIQVRWIIHNRNNNNSLQENNNNDDNNNKSISLWWDATLLPYTDYRTHTLSNHDDNDDNKKDEITLPIRTLEYDAKPDQGFPQKSTEDVIFLTPETLMSLSSYSSSSFEGDGNAVSEEQPWRIASSSSSSLPSPEITIPATEEATRAMLEVILQSSLAKFTTQMDKLPASAKAVIAEKMALSKERMVQGLMKRCSGAAVVTPECVQECVADMMKEEEDCA